MFMSQGRPPLLYRLGRAQRAWRREIAQQYPGIAHGAAAVASIAAAALLRYVFAPHMSRRGTALMAVVVAGALLTTWWLIPAEWRHPRHLRRMERDLLMAVGTAAGTVAAVVRALLRGSSEDAILSYLAALVLLAASLSNAGVEAWIALHWLKPRRGVEPSKSV